MFNEATVRRIVNDALNDADFDEIEIVAVNVRPGKDHDGDPVVIVKVVYDGRAEDLDPKKTLGVLTTIAPKIADVREGGFPVLSFVSKSDIGKLRPESI
jgi:hypothetical protein